MYRTRYREVQIIITSVPKNCERVTMLSQESIQSASVGIWLSGLAQLSIITGRCVTKTTGNFPGDFREKAPEVCTIMDH